MCIHTKHTGKLTTLEIVDLMKIQLLHIWFLRVIVMFYLKFICENTKKEGHLLISS